ncbi:MAG: carbon starvation protein A [Bacteroidota bacterium]
MITFIISVVALILGYVIYGKFIEKVFGANKEAITPAYSKEDGVDFVPMGWAKIFLIQFLNIAGLGPIFGAVAGAMWGPVAFLWIVLGCIFAGAVHDYLSGMLSIRLGGWSIPEIIGKYLGTGIKQFMRVFTIILMILVGAVFVMGPAKILDSISQGYLSVTFWAVIVFVYYMLATMLPIDKLIGKIYPFFGFCLLFMAIGITGAMFYYNAPIPELTLQNFTNMHSQGSSMPIFPMMFVTIACGAISGFHATQSPLMARCIKNEKLGRRVFYGAMITEGIVALIWAAAGMAFFGGVKELNIAMNEHQGNAAWVVDTISRSWLGSIGGILALLGVVAAPITSGDTALRSARLIIADFLNLEQKSIRKRLYISVPIFVACFLLMQVGFDVIWRYMAWSNQTLAMVVLWAVTVYMFQEHKPYIISLVPAIFMTVVCSCYILVAPEGLQLPQNIAYPIGGAISAAIVGFFVVYTFRYKRKIQKLTSN